MNDIAAYYDHLAAVYGHDPRAVDASSQAALDARYQALGDVCDMNGKAVLEIGCGYGGLGAYLTHRYPRIDYRGIDVSDKLIAVGREAHPELRLFRMDMVDLMYRDGYDIVLAQGIFYKLDRHPWKKSKRLIAQMYSLSAEVCAFTALIELQQGLEAGERDDPELDNDDPRLGAGHEYRLDADRTLRYCATLANGVGIRHDYHPGDALFALYRKERL